MLQEFLVWRLHKAKAARYCFVMGKVIQHAKIAGGTTLAAAEHSLPSSEDGGRFPLGF